MMFFNTGHDRLRQAHLTQIVSSKSDVRSFFRLDDLTDIVKQTTEANNIYIGSDFRGDAIPNFVSSRV